MRFDLLAFFKKNPRLAFILLIGLSFFTTYKLWNEAKIEGYLGFPEFRLTTVVDTYKTQSHRRRFGWTDHCHVKAQDYQGKIYDTTIDCDDEEKYQKGATIELVHDGLTWTSRSIEKGSLSIDLILLLAEIFGAIYYFRLARSSKPLPV